MLFRSHNESDESFEQRKARFIVQKEEELLLIGQNSSKVSHLTVDYDSELIPQYYERLGEALEHNTYVTDIKLWSGGSADALKKILLFVEKSDTLKQLYFGGYNLEMECAFLQALCRRIAALDYLRLPMYMRVEHMLDFRAFLLHTPRIKHLELSFSLQQVPTWLFSGVLSAATAAPIESLHFPNTEFPADLLAAFRQNQHLKHVQINFDQSFASLREERDLQDTCSTLRGCRGASFKVSLFIYHIEGNDWDRRATSVLVDELQDHSAFSELIFRDANIVSGGDIAVDFFTSLQGTCPKIKFENGDPDDWTPRTPRCIDAIVASAPDLDVGFEFYGRSFEYLLLALSKPTSVVAHLRVYLIDMERIDVLVERLPTLTKLRSLSCDISLDLPHGLFYHFDEPGETMKSQFNDLSVTERLQRAKDKITRALWKNRCLTDQIKVDFVDAQWKRGKRLVVVESSLNEEFLTQITQRNKFLPGLLDPKRLIEMNPAFLPYVLKASSETDLDELYGAICSVSSKGNVFKPKDPIHAKI